MITFILGGVKGGKSMLAQFIAKRLSENSGGKLIYLATMLAGDEEDEKRIARHVKDRENWGFETVEENYNLSDISELFSKKDVILLDSITAYVQNIIFRDPLKISEVTSEEIYAHIESLSNSVRDIVIVSDYIFSDAVQYNEEIEIYKDVLGGVHTLTAHDSDVVIECAYSNMKFWKNKKNYDFTSILNDYYGLKSHLEYKDI